MSGNDLAVFDLDGTVTRHDTLLPFVLGFVWRHPWRWLRLALVVPALCRYPFQRDRGALKGAVIHTALGGVSRPQLRAWTQRFVPTLLRRGLFAEALAAIAAHRARGERLLLMSASPDLYVPEIAAALGFDASICTGVRWRADDRLDGQLATPNCRGAEKRRQLERVLAREAPTLVAAYGNSVSDLDHMQLAQRGILINTIPSGAVDASIELVRWSTPAGV